MFKRNLCLILILFCWMLLTPVFPRSVRADESITAAITTNRSELTVGDEVELTLLVIHPAGHQLLPLDLGETWGEFELFSVSPVTVEQNRDGTETSLQIIRGTLWRPGEFTTPTISASVRDGEGTVQQVEVVPASLTVMSVLVEGDNELRDIKPQAGLPLPLSWPWVAAIVILLVMVALLLRRLMRRWVVKGKDTDQQPAPDLRPAHQIALAELARIEQLGLPAQGRFKEHYSLVTDALRGYLEAAFGVPALDRTTGEIRQALKPTSWTPMHKTGLVHLLGDADLVKFAKLIPDQAAAEQLPEQAREIVLETRPIQTSPSQNGESSNPAEPAT